MNTPRCCPDGVLLAVAVGVFVAVAVCVAVAVPVVVAVGVAVSVGEDVPDGVPVAVVVGLAVRVGVWVLAAEGGGREGAHADRTGMERENPQHIKKQLVAYVWVSEHRFWWCACVWALLNLERRMLLCRSDGILIRIHPSQPARGIAYIWGLQIFGCRGKISQTFACVSGFMANNAAEIPPSVNSHRQ